MADHREPCYTYYSLVRGNLPYHMGWGGHEHETREHGVCVYIYIYIYTYVFTRICIYIYYSCCKESTNRCSCHDVSDRLKWKEKMFKQLQHYQGTAQRQLAKLLHLFEGSWPAPNLHRTTVCAKTQSFANEPHGQVVTASGWLVNRQIYKRLDSSNA